MSLKELRKERLWEEKRKQLLRDVIIDAVKDWTRATAIAELFEVSTTDLNNFKSGRRNYSSDKVERLLAKCWIWEK